MSSRRTLLAALASLLPAAALAHGEGARGANGGMIADLGDRHIELLARDGEIRVWVLDAQDRAVPPAGTTGTLIVLAQGRQQTLRLEPGEGATFLVARGDFRAAPGMRVVANMTFPGLAPRQARFTPAG
jgi:hypothetical protein